MQHDKPVKSAVAGILALSLSGLSMSVLAVPDQPKNWEKCTGIAKAGMNDCGALDGTHNCAGKSTVDNSSNEWLYVPQGTCTKVTGGVVNAVKSAKS